MLQMFYVGFNFGHHFCEESLTADNDNYEYPYLKLVEHLWSGKLYRLSFGIYFEQVH